MTASRNRFTVIAEGRARGERLGSSLKSLSGLSVLESFCKSKLLIFPLIKTVTFIVENLKNTERNKDHFNCTVTEAAYSGESVPYIGGMLPPSM